MADLELRADGLKTAVADAHEPDAVVPGSMDAEQMALLPLPQGQARRVENGKVVTPQRGVGRPKGAKNKNTKEWRDYLLSKYSSPLEMMAATMTRSVDDLAIDLGYTKLDDDGRVLRRATPEEMKACLSIQLSCAKELAPFVHQKQPQAIELGDQGLMTLNIFSAPVQDVQNADEFSLEVMDLETEENQGVSAEENEKSNAQKSNENAQNVGDSDEEGENAPDYLSVGQGAAASDDQDSEGGGDA